MINEKVANSIILLEKDTNKQKATASNDDLIPDDTLFVKNNYSVVLPKQEKHLNIENPSPSFLVHEPNKNHKTFKDSENKLNKTTINYRIKLIQNLLTN